MIRRGIWTRICLSLEIITNIYCINVIFILSLFQIPIFSIFDEKIFIWYIYGKSIRSKKKITSTNICSSQVKSIGITSEINYLYNLIIFFNVTKNKISEIYIQKTNSQTNVPKLPVNLNSKITFSVETIPNYYGEIASTNNNYYINGGFQLANNSSSQKYGFTYFIKNDEYQINGAFSYNYYTTIDTYYFFNFTIDSNFFNFLKDNYQ